MISFQVFFFWFRVAAFFFLFFGFRVGFWGFFGFTAEACWV